MATVEERVAFLEGRVGEHGAMIDGIRDAVVALEVRLDRRFEALEERIDRRFEALDQRLSGFEERVDRRFTWLIGLQVTTMASVLTAFAAVVVALFD